MRVINRQLFECTKNQNTSPSIAATNNGRGCATSATTGSATPPRSTCRRRVPHPPLRIKVKRQIRGQEKQLQLDQAAQTHRQLPVRLRGPPAQEGVTLQTQKYTPLTQIAPSRTWPTYGWSRTSSTSCLTYTSQSSRTSPPAAKTAPRRYATTQWLPSTSSRVNVT
jgi:hypothetical protein